MHKEILKKAITLSVDFKNDGEVSGLNRYGQRARQCKAKVIHDESWIQFSSKFISVYSVDSGDQLKALRRGEWQWKFVR